MKGPLFLAWRYVVYNRVKTGILVVSLTLTIVLPLTAKLLVDQYGAALSARARSTPLVIGAKGNRFDLVLKALYFKRAEVDPVYASQVEEVRESGLAEAIPLHLGFTAAGKNEHPIVGTTLEYFDFRGLRVREGRLPSVLGQAVLGARAAADLKLGVGESLLSNQEKLYDITQTYPLKMHVVGVLAETGTPDDGAVFVDVKTAWIIAGIMHGHQDVARTEDDSIILGRTEDTVVTNAAIVQYNEVTPENVDSFHLHAVPAALPLSAIIAVPKDEKSRTLIKARYEVSEYEQMLSPALVVEELLGLVFRVKRFFEANFVMVAISTGLFLVLIVLLSHRLRRREMETMHRIGCSRGMALRLQAAEMAIVLIASAVFATVLSVAAVLAAPRLVSLI